MGKSTTKKKKANTKKTPIQIGGASLSYMPGSDDKTALVSFSPANPKLAGEISSYSIRWTMRPWQGNWMVAQDSSSSSTTATWDIPTNAAEVGVEVKVSGVSNTNKYSPGGNIARAGPIAGPGSNATTPSSVSTSIDTVDKTWGTVRIDNYVDSSPAHTTTLVVEIVQRSGDSLNQFGNLQTIGVSYGTAICHFRANIGCYYKARAKALGNGGLGIHDSAWSSYSSEVTTIPAKVDRITAIRSEKQQGDSWPVYLSWTAVGNADKYKIEYTITKSHFDTEADDVYNVETEGRGTSRIVTNNIQSGKKWYFRVRAVNSVGEGEPCGISEVIVGSVPAAPTTWSYQTVAKQGEDVVLCWTHNSTDGSFMEKAKVAYKIGATGTYTEQEVTIILPDGNPQTQDTDPSKVVTTYAWKFNTTAIPDSSVVYWKVKTKGILSSPDGGYGEYSTERQFTVYEPPTLAISVTDGTGESVDLGDLTGVTDDTGRKILTCFPLTIATMSGPQTQTPIGLYYEITAEQDYEITGEDGNDSYVVSGELIYKRYAVVTEHEVTLTLNPGDIFLADGIRYTVAVTVSMSNGLSTKVDVPIYTQWSAGTCGLSADITIDPDNLIAFVRPFAYDPSIHVEDPEHIEDIEIREGYLLSVYRRELNGTFDLIGEGLDVADGATLVDIHPALDYARYRIVAISKSSGMVTFYDMPGEEVGERGIAIHWNERWLTVDEGVPSYQVELPELNNYKMGSLLVIPYNVDINDDMGKEASLVSYAGRTYPVSYYGTQRSLTSKWTVQVPKSDKATMNAIRRLAMYGGDSYVREPNGTGYWAALTLSYAINHHSAFISVNFNITRVEGEDTGVIKENTEQTIWTEAEQEG